MYCVYLRRVAGILIYSFHAHNVVFKVAKIIDHPLKTEAYLQKEK